MKRFFGGKTAILLLGGLSILVIIYLITSLGSLELKPARPFTYIQETEYIPPGSPPAWNGLVYVSVFFAVLLVIIFFLLTPEQRKKYIRALAWLVLAGIIIFLILSKFSLGNSVSPPPAETQNSVVPLSSEPTDTPMPAVTPSVFVPPQVSSWTSYLVALVLLLAVAGGWGWLVWRKRKMGAPYDALAEIAQSALKDIEAGKDWGDAILNSYYRMNRAVADWRGIRRRESMTPAEFADFLVSAHLPREAVDRLTALFERVRYGGKKSTRKDIKEAVDCLTAISDYCQRAR